MKGGEPLTMREASFISSLMGHAQHIDAATVRFTMHIDGSLDGQINLAALAKRGGRRRPQEAVAAREARQKMLLKGCGEQSAVERRAARARCWRPDRRAGSRGTTKLAIAPETAALAL